MIPRTRSLGLWLLVALAPLLLASAPLSPGRESGHSSSVAWEPASNSCVTAPLGSSDPELESLLRDVLGERIDRFGVVVHHLESGTGAAVNPDNVFRTASLFKLPIMYELFRQRELGRLSFGERMTITERNAAWDLGTLRGWASVGDAVSLDRLMEMMIVISDNASAVMLANRVGWSQVDQSTRELGLCDTRIAAEAPFTTAADMAVLLLSIAEGSAVSPEASAEMEQVLLLQGVRDRIPAGVPEEVPVGNKTANLSNATHDVGIVYAPGGAYVLAVLSDLAWEGGPIVELSSAVHDYYDARFAAVERFASAAAWSDGRFLAY